MCMPLGFVDVFKISDEETEFTMCEKDPVEAAGNLIRNLGAVPAMPMVNEALQIL